MTVAEPRPSDTTAFRAAIVGIGRVRLSSDEVWAAWCSAVPRLVGAPDQRQVLLRCLRLLADEQVIELPARMRDVAALTTSPAFVTVPGARRPERPRPWTAHPWRAQLGWVSSLATLSDELFADLIAINTWLGATDGQAVTPVPVRYRSAEILGREKRLDELMKTRQFGDGRLTLELLRCVRVPPPLPAAPVGEGVDALVVENSDTYWVVLDALRRTHGHGIGTVVWGGGRSFPTQIVSLGVDVAGRGPVKGTIWYWGDYDPSGITIATEAARAAGLLDFHPAADLWAAMADVPVQQAGEYDWSGSEGASWLGTSVWDRLRPVRAVGGRVAQEAVPVAVVEMWARRHTASPTRRSPSPGRAGPEH